MKNYLNKILSIEHVLSENEFNMQTNSFLRTGV